MSAIGRRQAWAALIVLMADAGLPDPKSIDFNAQAKNEIVTLHFDDAAALAAWAAALGAEIDPPQSHRVGVVQHSAHGYNSWHGLSVFLMAYVPVEPVPQPLGDDLSSLRALAAVA